MIHKDKSSLSELADNSTVGGWKSQTGADNDYYD
jgi:hypothetical protein